MQPLLYIEYQKKSKKCKSEWQRQTQLKRNTENHNTQAIKQLYMSMTKESRMRLNPQSKENYVKIQRCQFCITSTKVCIVQPQMHGLTLPARSNVRSSPMLMLIMPDQDVENIGPVISQKRY